jgi:hypothetical protein
MSYARTHVLGGRGFGSKEMSFGERATERSLNAVWVMKHHLTTQQAALDLRAGPGILINDGCSSIELVCLFRFRVRDTFKPPRFAFRSSSSSASLSSFTTE